MTKLLRYGLASLGPIGSAGAQFLLSLILLRTLDGAQFGSFAFLLVASQLVTSLWSALFCAPLLVLMTRTPVETRLVRAIFSTSLALTLGAGLVFLGIALALGLGPSAAAIFAVAAAAALVRWLARSHAYASGLPWRAMWSDLLYSAILIAGALVMWIDAHPPQEWAYLILFVGAAIALLPFGMRYARAQFGDASLSDLAHYAPVWRDYSGWSLIGVLSTEATMNSQAYLVTAIAGPAAFAPIAATSLLIRPIIVATNALTDFERAQMARDIGAGSPEAAVRSTSLFRWAILAIWLGSAVAAAALLAVAPHLIFPPRYSLSILAIGTASWFVVAFVRSVRIPESALLQAAGEFRSLAWASIYACAFSIVSVLIALLLAAPIWSIASILTGEIAFTWWIFSAARTWIRT